MKRLALLLIIILFLTSLACFQLFPVKKLNEKELYKPFQTSNNVKETLQKNKREPAQLNLEKIFDDQIDSLNDNDTRLIATGDVIPARLTDLKIRSRGAYYPFESLTELLKQGNITLVNLEAPLIKNCPAHSEGMKFCGQAIFAQAMKDNGITEVSLENNHIGNYGEKGIEETINALETVGLGYVTAEKPDYVVKNGVRFGFVAWNGVGPRFDKEQIRETLRIVKDSADVVIVSVHWGKEYTYIPQKAPGIAWDDPKEIGHFLVDNGADLIIGNHPHWVQGVEIYRDSVITYAHGNFIFDQSWSDETMEGVVGEYIFNKDRLVDIRFHPIIITNNAKPVPADQNKKMKILNKMQMASEELRKN